MQEKVQQWLDQRIAEENKKHETEKDELVLSLGLIDDSVPLKYFANYSGREISKEVYEKDKAHGYDVSIIASPLRISDEEYEEILKHLPSERTISKSQNVGGKYIPARPSDFSDELDVLMKIERHTNVVSTAVIIYIILSLLIGIIIGTSLGSL